MKRAVFWLAAVICFVVAGCTTSVGSHPSLGGMCAAIGMVSVVCAIAGVAND